MNCSNCGAPLDIVLSGEHFACPYCNSLHFPTFDDEGIALLGEAPEGLSCPLCSQPLQRAKIDQWSGYQCQQCQGLLIGQENLGEIVKYRRATATGPPDRPKPLDRRGLDRALVCPRCTQPMSTHPYLGPGNFVIDTCMRCDLTWLDYGELKKIANYPGPDRGRGTEAETKQRRLDSDSDDDDDN